jgi:hypothetical protein
MITGTDDEGLSPMSDRAQESGWWIALDGKWYPPAQDIDNGPVVSAYGGASHPGSTLPTQHDLVDFAVGPVAVSPTKVRARDVRSIGLILLAIMVLIGGGALAYSLAHGSGKNAIIGASPNEMARLTAQAVKQAGSVHVVTTIQLQGGTATYVNDIAARSGKQVITAASAEVTAIAANGIVYVNANQLAMSELFQAPSAAGEKYANKWLFFPSSSQAYKAIVQTLTIGSLLKQVTPTGQTSKLGPSVVRGQSVIGLRGHLPGGLFGTLYIADTGSPLPVEEESTTNGDVTTSTFSAWGEPVNAVPPKSAIPGSETGLF